MQTFVVDRKNICSRFDAYYYQPKYKMLEQRIKSKYSVSSFQDLTVGVTNGLDYRAFVDEGIPYIRVGDIGKGEVHFRKVKRVPKKLLNEKKSAVPKKGNLLLTRKGSYGNAAVYETTDEAIVSSEVFCVRLGERIIPEYMAIFINSELGRLQFERNAVGAIMGSISQNALSSVFVPVPPQDVQEKIVTIMKEAYEKKRKLEQEAKKIETELSDFVVKALEISLPGGSKSMAYVALSQDVKDRLDPYYHSPVFSRMYTSINNYKRVEKLVNLTKLIDYGLMPTQDYARSEDEGVPMIRVTNIKSDGSIDMSDVKYIKTDTPRLDEKRVKTGDILMVQCGSTTGKVAMVPSECDGYTFGSFSFVIRADDGILTQDYLFEVLSSELVQRQIRHTWNVVTVRPNTSKPNVQNLLIPVPSKAKQVEIAQKCASMRSSIHCKRKTADTGVENARDEVERMILGRE